jgi:hypothetical protein
MADSAFSSLRSRLRLLALLTITLFLCTGCTDMIYGKKADYEGNIQEAFVLGQIDGELGSYKFVGRSSTCQDRVQMQVIMDEHQSDFRRMEGLNQHTLPGVNLSATANCYESK